MTNPNKADVVRCADQNVADFDALRHAVASGRVQAAEG